MRDLGGNTEYPDKSPGPSNNNQTKNSGNGFFSLLKRSKNKKAEKTRK